MHYADINAALIKRDLDQTKVAKSLAPSVDPSLVTRVIHGEKRSRRVEEAISSATGIPLWRLWPKWHSRPRARKVA